MYTVTVFSSSAFRRIVVCIIMFFPPFPSTVQTISHPRSFHYIVFSPHVLILHTDTRSSLSQGTTEANALIASRCCEPLFYSARWHCYRQTRVLLRIFVVDSRVSVQVVVVVVVFFLLCLLLQSCKLPVRNFYNKASQKSFEISVQAHLTHVSKSQDFLVESTIRRNC